MKFWLQNLSIYLLFDSVIYLFTLYLASILFCFVLFYLISFVFLFYFISLYFFTATNMLVAEYYQDKVNLTKCYAFCGEALSPSPAIYTSLSIFMFSTSEYTKKSTESIVYPSVYSLLVLLTNKWDKNTKHFQLLIKIRILSQKRYRRKSVIPSWAGGH